MYLYSLCVCVCMCVCKIQITAGALVDIPMTHSKGKQSNPSHLFNFKIALNKQRKL